jgi:hypothetical protein
MKNHIKAILISLLVTLTTVVTSTLIVYYPTIGFIIISVLIFIGLYIVTYIHLKN